MAWCLPSDHLASNRLALKPPASCCGIAAIAAARRRASDAANTHSNAAAATYLPSLSRRSRDPLPPLGAKATGLLPLREGLWCLRQDFTLTENIYLNTHIVRLRSGGLMLINPPAATEEAVALLRSLTGGDPDGSRGEGSVAGGCGPCVEHVVCINLSPEHWYNAPDWAPYCSSNATLWTVPGLLQGRSTASLLGGPERVRLMKEVYGRVLELPDAGPLPGLESEVEVATFHESGGWFSESTLWLRDHRAVVFGDMGFAAYDYRPSNALSVQMAKMVGIYQRLGCPVIYVMLQKDPRAARAWLDRVLRWEVDKVLCSHLDALVVEGAAEIRRCFGFLLR
ncbi:hypothetical protein VOLCADRAFT_92621 [Volvox carteri f. nagariensis]|uniref:Metallo-beta-lactamase domain-containing protein n=1 Tax=Volvox carteri f. nagariensis TaxID=3068 RepID=D8U046_VOLCA|nr:uncharacterized protein VOLCADRAFT_92621 [Volvox carteri f. nagariensis]EFJ46874.1 hypothetical protein VOLCADRAFT_92621 [Volvox carteri f. nagariensis]|eukprot:XP_002952083.1 hypothetical protein VOLCADRAFT_92621 [Volvox carteri f. nagariensis]